MLLSDLKQLEVLDHPWVDVVVVLALSTNQLFMDLVILEKFGGVHMFVKELVQLVNIWRCKVDTSVQSITQLVVGVGQRMENLLHTMFKRSFIQLSTLVGEKVRCVEHHKDGKVDSKTSDKGHFVAKVSEFTAIAATVEILCHVARANACDGHYLQFA